MRLFFIIWRQNEIFELLHRIDVYLIKEEQDFTVIANKLKSFTKWITYFYSYAIFMGVCITVGVPFIRSKKNLFLNVGFPLDYKNDEISFWIVFLFVFTETSLSISSVSYSIIIWYLMFNCALVIMYWETNWKISEKLLQTTFT